jgi:hypothetical protein
MVLDRAGFLRQRDFDDTFAQVAQHMCIGAQLGAVCQSASERTSFVSYVLYPGRE